MTVETKPRFYRGIYVANDVIVRYRVDELVSKITVTGESIRALDLLAPFVFNANVLAGNKCVQSPVGA